MANTRGELFQLFAQKSAGEVSATDFEKRLSEIVEEDTQEASKIVAATLNRRVRSAMSGRVDDVRVLAEFEVSQPAPLLHISVAALPVETALDTETHERISGTVTETLSSFGMGEATSLTVNGK